MLFTPDPDDAYSRDVVYELWASLRNAALFSKAQPDDDHEVPHQHHRINQARIGKARVDNSPG